MEKQEVMSQDLLGDLIQQAKKAGACQADALLIQSQAIECQCRLGQFDRIERSEGQDLGLRVVIDKKQAIASSNNWSTNGIKKLVDQAIRMAKAAPRDPFCGLATTAQLTPYDQTDLELFDSNNPDVETLKRWALETEEAALSLDGIENSDGAQASWSNTHITLVTSHGFLGHRHHSSYSRSVAVIAPDKHRMNLDYDYDVTRYLEDLRTAKDIGQTAAKRALKNRNAQKVKTCKAPVVFDKRVSKSLVSILARALNGDAIARNTSFLKDAMGQSILPSNLSLVDDPLRRRGLGSRAFDVEGIPTKKLSLIDKGQLKSWLLDLRIARKLNLPLTGHASRNPASPPTPTPSNIYLTQGDVSFEDLIADIKSGLLVTSLMGFGVNLITGDYSQGAEGFWIENGHITYPVTEVTIAGNLKEMFRSMTAANDLELRMSVEAPTLKMQEMTIAGH